MNWRRALVAALFAAPVIGLFAWGMTRDPKYIPSPLPGREGPTFALEVFAPGVPPIARPAGDTISLAAFRGQIVVVNFWASWCLACRDEHADLSATALRYAGQPVQFVGVLYMDQIEPALRWITEMGGQTYPSVNDPRSRAAIDYGLYGVPETFILDAQGRVAHKQTGPISAGLLTHLVDSLLVAAGASDTAASAPTAGTVSP
ncbi:MAG: TlpA family protein disulfide reductase [Gemmatimonadota bacterium]|nr:TlpA family protein disulfide reductase [Gemmatimonadota bacterium]